VISATLSAPTRTMSSSEAVVLGDLLACERDESFFTWAAMDQRLPCEHRSDINPAALLAVMVVSAPRVGGNGSPREHAIDVVHHSGQRK
jgi:hypothetical protein